ncbi:Prenylcysteine lyase-domain-containing protein [Sparassis latifolia]
MHTVLLLLPLITATHAFQIPFFSRHQTPLSPAQVTQPAEPPNKIAVIGAGAGGSSAAFWIAKARERFGLDVEVDVYERSGYIGGRSTVVHPYGDAAYEPVELGASIFVGANKILWRATDEFGLERIDFGDDDDGVMGIWDGGEFVVENGGGFFGGWWNTLKALWRYGYHAPRKTQALVRSMVSDMLTLYAPGTPGFPNMTALADTLGWAGVIAQTTTEYFDLQGVDRRWTREVIDAVTRVNYGQNAHRIHALEGMASLAATGATSVKGGNFQLFEQFLARSNASVRLNTSVTSLVPTKHGWVLTSSSESTAQTQTQTYRGVVLAAPFHTSALALPEAVAALVPPQPYVHLHVTLLSTRTPRPSAAYFGVARPPTEVLTTSAGAERGGRAPEFNSLTYHGRVRRRDGEEAVPEEWVVKIFSRERVGDAWLEGVFGDVGWVLRKEWDAYPVLRPTARFPPIRLAKGLYYVNAFEPFISTMETAALAARNAVGLLLSEEFGAGVCPARAPVGGGEEGEEGEKKGFVFGFDC